MFCFDILILIYFFEYKTISTFTPTFWTHIISELGGVLYLNIEINRRYVITAAHCHDKKLRRFQIKEVVLGEWDLEKDPDCEGSCKKVQRFNIRPRDVTMYEDWDINKVTTNGNDIALIRLLEISGY